MEIEIYKMPVKGLVERLVRGLGWLGRHMGIWDDRFTRSQNQGMFDQSGSIRMTL